MNDIIELEPGLKLQPAEISFAKFEAYKAMARQTAEVIRSMEPSEENMAQARDMVARARRVTDELDKVRIRMKKQIMQPYEEFETQIREISGIVAEAESEVRTRINELDRQAREAKKERLRALFTARAQWYTFPKARPDAFELWLEPRHTTRTMTEAKAEAEMTAFLEAHERSYSLCRDMGLEYETLYLETLDFERTIAIINRRTEKPEEETDDRVYTIRVKGLTTFMLAQHILRVNDIKFESED